LEYIALLITFEQLWFQLSIWLSIVNHSQNRAVCDLYIEGFSVHECQEVDKFIDGDVVESALQNNLRTDILEHVVLIHQFSSFLDLVAQTYLALVTEFICQSQQGLEAELELKLSIHAHHFGQHPIRTPNVAIVNEDSDLGPPDLLHEGKPANASGHILQA
jgi:hypothetical protein